jgi:hypothetical protein
MTTFVQQTRASRTDATSHPQSAFFWRHRNAAQSDAPRLPCGIVTFVTQEGPVYRASLSDAGSGTVAWHTSAEATAFIRIEVRDRNGHMAALSNPIILT